MTDAFWAFISFSWVQFWLHGPVYRNLVPVMDWFSVTQNWTRWKHNAEVGWIIYRLKHAVWMLVTDADLCFSLDMKQFTLLILFLCNTLGVKMSHLGKQTQPSCIFWKMLIYFLQLFSWKARLLLFWDILLIETVKEQTKNDTEEMDNRTGNWPKLDLNLNDFLTSEWSVWNKSFNAVLFSASSCAEMKHFTCNSDICKYFGTVFFIIIIFNIFFLYYVFFVRINNLCLPATFHHRFNWSRFIIRSNSHHLLTTMTFASINP